MTGVLVGGKKRQDVLAHHKRKLDLQKAEAQYSDTPETACPLKTPSISQFGYDIEAKAVQGPFSYLLSQCRIVSQGYTRHMYPRLVRDLHTSHMAGKRVGIPCDIYTNISEWTEEWLDVVIQEQQTLDRLILNVYEAPGHVTEIPGPKKMTGYRFDLGRPTHQFDLLWSLLNSSVKTHTMVDDTTWTISLEQLDSVSPAFFNYLYGLSGKELGGQQERHTPFTINGYESPKILTVRGGPIPKYTCGSLHAASRGIRTQEPQVGR